ncbi:MAG: alpha/beta fold hydrolase [Intrasporangium sp.]|uniref:alpha/beta fold hydrolase n=1 Tax=Intrasporangium sp. TaxID=1925024 RepID=UPI003F817325
MLETMTTRGPLQYDERGSGIPVLLLHGTPGGCDQALALAGMLNIDAPVIAPTRPGYLGTPLETGRTPEEQADAAAALLDDLGVGRAVVLGVSGGGMSAVKLAVRHPHRVARMVLWEAVTGPTELTVGNLLRGPLSSRLGGKLLVKAVQHTPRLALPRAAAGDPRTIATLQVLTPTMFPMDTRKAGTANDADQAATFVPDCLADISVPTLLVHGTADVNVPYAHSERAARTIPHARLVTIDGGDHYTTLAHPQAVAEVESFLGGLT